MIIHLELASGSVYATSVVLWAFTGDLGLGSVVLKVYLSDGESERLSTGSYKNYEYEENRKLGMTTAGYYRFSVDRCNHNGETITFEETWTEWYYLTNNVEYMTGTRYEH